MKIYKECVSRIFIHHVIWSVQICWSWLVAYWHEYRLVPNLFLSAFNLNFTLLSLLKILLKPPDMSGFLVNSHDNSIVFCVCVMMASFWFRWQILQLIQFVRKLSCHWWVFGSFFKFQFEVYVGVLQWKCSSARAPLWSDSSIVSRVTFES